MKTKKAITFILSLAAPVLPILAVLVFPRIADAMELMIACIVILCVVLWAVTGLLRTNEKSSGMKIVGTVFACVGVIITAVIGLLSGWAMTKM